MSATCTKLKGLPWYLKCRDFVRIPVVSLISRRPRQNDAKIFEFSTSIYRSATSINFIRVLACESSANRVAWLLIFRSPSSVLCTFRISLRNRNNYFLSVQKNVSEISQKLNGFRKKFSLSSKMSISEDRNLHRVAQVLIDEIQKIYLHFSHIS